MNNAGYIMGPPTKAAYQKAQSAELKRQMMIYSAEIFAKKLEDFGMKSYHDEGLCWYKVENGEVLQSVYFVSETKYPFLVSIFYGLHPLYYRLNVPLNHYIPTYKLGHDETMIFLRGVQRGYKKMLPGTTINYLRTPERGAEWLDLEVFPLFRDHQTASSVYSYWKSVYYGPNLGKCFDRFGFYEQVIYENDVPLFEVVYNERKPDIDRPLPLRASKILRENRHRLEQIMDVFRTGDCSSYLVMLEERKKKLIRQLEARVGIMV